MKKKRSRWISAIVLASMLFASCTVGNYGYLKPNLEAQEIFESYRILPQYKYYYAGADADPTVIIGLNKEYTLRSNLWFNMAADPETLKDKIEYMTNMRGWSSQSRGSSIIGPDGNQIGIWYSDERTTTVKLNDSEVAITPPKRNFFSKGDRN